jgi:DNA-nicking Smr family endonuclease
MAKDKPFNNPFGGIKLQKDEPKPGAKPAPKPPARYDAPKAKPTSEEEEAAMFLQSVGGVEPVRTKSDRAPVQKPPPPGRGSNEEEEALLQLAELVAGQGPLEVANSDEYVEGAAPGLDPQIVRKLNRGDYAVQAQLDLHGLSRADAKQQLEVFLRTAQQRHFRSVLVVQSRGLPSEDALPALKESVQSWLTGARLSKLVLAFATARPQDGGTGAAYVLLRR